MTEPMPGVLPIVKPRLVTDALARTAYVHDQVRIANGEVAGFDCLVASRQGLFAAAGDGRVSRVAWGSFFGGRRHGPRIYAFEACDRPSSASKRGRIVSLGLCDGRIDDPRVLVRGLDNNCHQIAVIDECLCVVDTANQQVLRFTLAGEPIGNRPVLAPAQPETGDDPYRHINSIAQINGRIALMLHNGGAGRDRPSELAWLDRDWNIAERIVLPGRGCHDIVADDKGRIWHCGSMAGDIINSDGHRMKVSTMMTRGLAFGSVGLVVGYSQFGIRVGRERLAGGLLFLDGDLAVRSDVPLDAAPTDIVLLDEPARHDD